MFEKTIEDIRENRIRNIEKKRKEEEIEDKVSERVEKERLKAYERALEKEQMARAKKEAELKAKGRIDAKSNTVKKFTDAILGR